MENKKERSVMIYNEVCNLHKEKVMKWWEGRGGEGPKKNY